MIVSLVVAMDEKRGIGLHNRLPWRLSADLKNFKAVTMGHSLIMGRKTYETIGRALPGRKTILLSRQPHYRPENCPADACQVASSLDEALRFAAASAEDEAFIIGGGEVFEQALPAADRIYLTQVHTRGPADVFFPPYEHLGWVETERFDQPADEKNEHAFTFRLLERAASA